MFFVIMKKKTLTKLINEEVDKVVNASYTLGYKLGQESRARIELEVERILKEKGF